MNRLTIILITFLCLVIKPALCCSRVIVRQSDDLVKVFSKPNTTYIIKENLNLEGNKIILGEGCTLVFQGGSLSNGTIVGNNTRVKSGNNEIFKRGYVRYHAYIAPNASKNDPPSFVKKYHNCIFVEGTWSNSKCGYNWTGLQNQSDEDVMLAVKNYITLHAEGVNVIFPTINSLGYESVQLPGGHVIDFNNTSISYPNDFSIWEDNTIELPDGAQSCSMESGYGLLSLTSNTVIKNLFIDAKSTFRQDEPLRLGVSCILSVGYAQNVIIDNVNISNVLGPAVTAQSKSKNLTFKNCRFYNIGEHVIYSHQYLGYCHFENCIFDTWDSERLSVFRTGLDYLYKHTPPINDGSSYEELYSFDLKFTNCTFNNPLRVNSQGRTLGGFFNGSFPVIISIDDCKFRGAFPAVNPDRGYEISEKSGKTYRLVVRRCDGAPYIYPAKFSYNIITEFYDCVNIDFRTAYAKHYENCEMNLDVYESNIENVSEQFLAEFSEPMVIKKCNFIDRGNESIINHPVFHRPILFDSCTFTSKINRNTPAEVVTIKTEKSISVTFDSCQFDIPGFRLVGGNIAKERILFINCTKKSVID